MISVFFFFSVAEWGTLRFGGVYSHLVFPTVCFFFFTFFVLFFQFIGFPELFFFFFFVKCQKKMGKRLSFRGGAIRTSQNKVNFCKAKKKKKKNQILSIHEELKAS